MAYLIWFVIGGDLYSLFLTDTLTSLQEVSHKTGMKHVEVNGSHVVHATADLFLE